jgi:hypothetical protein
MAQLAVQSIDRLGLAPGYVAATGGGDTFDPTESPFLHVKNGGGSAITVTVLSPGEIISFVTKTSSGVSVPAGGERMIGSYPAEHFRDATDGLAHITYSGVTSVTVGVFAPTRP